MRPPVPGTLGSAQSPDGEGARGRGRTAALTEDQQHVPGARPAKPQEQQKRAADGPGAMHGGLRWVSSSRPASPGHVSASPRPSPPVPRAWRRRRLQETPNCGARGESAPGVSPRPGKTESRAGHGAADGTQRGTRGAALRRGPSPPRPIPRPSRTRPRLGAGTGARPVGAGPHPGPRARGLAASRGWGGQVLSGGVQRRGAGVSGRLCARDSGSGHRGCCARKVTGGVPGVLQNFNSRGPSRTVNATGGGLGKVSGWSRRWFALGNLGAFGPPSRLGVEVVPGGPNFSQRLFR